MKVELDVPDAIPMSKVRAFLADLGIDAKYLRELYVGMSGVYVGMSGVYVGMSGVYVEVVALDVDGKPYVEGNEIAVHRIAIPLDRDA